MIGKNIFIDFSIIKESNALKLKDEFDRLVALKNNIYLWSKVESVEQMRIYCLSISYDMSQQKETHKKVLELRKQKKSFKDISDETGVPMNQISFYLTSDSNKMWTLDDWIKGYLPKDSSFYQKVDFIIDPDKKLVERFKARGLDGNTIEKI